MNNDFFEKIENFLLTLLILIGIYAIFLHWK